MFVEDVGNELERVVIHLSERWEHIGVVKRDVYAELVAFGTEKHRGDLEKEVEQTAIEMWRRGDRVDAVRYLRDRTSRSIKECRDFLLLN